jgi:RimJ/RimL family protein N-acetyltransferase
VEETVVRTTYLEMMSPSDLKPSTKDVRGFSVSRVSVPCPELNRFMYEVVGRDWEWTFRLTWPHERWKTYVLRDTFSTWIAMQEGRTVGFFELEEQDEGHIEIKIFGLVPQFVGKGLGGHMLTQAIRTGWDLGAARVWVHTCTKDAPSALPNYLARGLRIYKEETGPA